MRAEHFVAFFGAVTLVSLVGLLWMWEDCLDSAGLMLLRSLGPEAFRWLGHCWVSAASGRCMNVPLWMAQHCSGYCDEELVVSARKRRVVLDSVVDETACKTLEVLAAAAAIPGDGYNGNAFPFSRTERFSGTTPAAAASWAMVQHGERRDSAVTAIRELLRAVRRVKSSMEDAFGKMDPSARSLALDYTSLSCREAVTNASTATVELGKRVVYADNCQRNGDVCEAGTGFWWRSFSGELHLSGSADGGGAAEYTQGELFYASDWRRGHLARVAPRCGRVAAYDSGPANIHGHAPLLRGRVCVLSVYLTRDTARAHHGEELDLAEAILDNRLMPDGTHIKSSDTVSKFYRSCTATAAHGGRDTASLQSVPRRPLSLDGKTVQVLELAPDPRIQLIEDFLNAEEIEHLIAKGRSIAKPSTVWENNKVVQASYRKSMSGWLPRGDDIISQRVERRIEQFAGLTSESGEQMQVAFYSAGNLGRYDPHLDWGTGPKDVRRDHKFGQEGRQAGARMATFLMYLNDVPEGGHTIFQELNLTITPRAGLALFWHNLLPSREGDMRVRHGACPVTLGEKAIATRWFREALNDHYFHEQEVARPARPSPKALARGIVPHLRVTVDGLLSQFVCDTILKVADAATILGDGYRSGNNPLSSREAFRGTTLSNVLRWAAAQPEDGARRGLAVMQAASVLEAVKAGYRRAQGLAGVNLFMDYIHLVCLDAEQADDGVGAPLSHPLHADNCFMENGVCVRDSPWNYWRSHSAILFLEEPGKRFGGGEFFFTEGPHNRTPSQTVKPACGRMVAFSAGEDNFHGVLPVRWGRRCALALWMTDDEEKAQAKAEIEQAQEALVAMSRNEL